MDRSASPSPTVRLTAGVVDLVRGVLTTDGAPIALTDIETELLRYLHRQRHRVVGRDELLVQVWGYRPGVRSHTVESTIQRMRAKIERDPKAPDHLRTVRGEGYRLYVPEPSLPEDGVLLEPIFGREDELRTVRAWLQEGARLVTITGPPGIGKTWLLRALVGDLAATDVEVGFVDLTGLRTRTELRDATTLPTQGVWMLDDAGDLEPDATEELTRWLRRSAGLALIVTAPGRLAVEGEQTLPLDLLSVDAAVRVLRSRLRALGIPEPEPGVLERVATRIERLPLALDVVAGALETHGPDDLALAGLLDASPVRKGTRTLREAVAHTVARLAPGPARALSELTVFRGTFSADAAAAVTSDRSGFDVLRRCSLVRRLPDGRFALYEAVRSAVPGDATGAAGRLADWIAGRADARDAPRALAGHRADLVALLAGGGLRDDQVLALVAVLGPLVVRYGATRDWETLQAAVARAGPAVRAHLCWLVAIEHRANGRYKAAAEYATQGLEADPDDALASRLWVLRAQGETDIGDPEIATGYARQAVACAESGGSDGDLIRALQALGRARATVDPLEAYDILARGARLAHAIGEPRTEAMMWGPAAHALLAAGLYEDALVAAERACALLGDDGQGEDRRTWAVQGFRLQALALVDRCDGVPRSELPAGAEASNGFVYGHVLVALRDGDRRRAMALLEALHADRVAVGSEEAAAVRELMDILAGRRTDGSWWFANALVAAARW